MNEDTVYCTVCCENVPVSEDGTVVCASMDCPQDQEFPDSGLFDPQEV